MQRTKLRDRLLPVYSPGEERLNTLTHIVGGALAVIGALLYLRRSAPDPLALTGAVIYSLSMVLVYAMSSIYHGLAPGIGKKVMQILDHCAIYLLIAGTYTPILLSGFLKVYPAIGWGLLLLQWGLAAVAVTLTAIDLRRFRVFSMVCYLFMGWGIIFFLPQAMAVMTRPGFLLLLAGGIAYTLGAITFGLGKKLRWMHGVFHIFVILGSALQYFAIYLYL